MDDELSREEAERLALANLRRMIATPPKPKAKPKGQSRAKPKKRKANQPS